MLEYVPNHSKTREICVDVVTEDQLLLRHVPGWFMVQQQLTQCDGYYDESGYIKWYDQKRKALGLEDIGTSLNGRIKKSQGK